jgi:hypothetical protein
MSLEKPQNYLGLVFEFTDHSLFMSEKHFPNLQKTSVHGIFLSALISLRMGSRHSEENESSGKSKNSRGFADQRSRLVLA